VPVRGRSRPDTETKEPTHKLEKFFVRWRVSIWIESITLAWESIGHSIVDCPDQQRKWWGFAFLDNISHHFSEWTTGILATLTFEIAGPEAVSIIIHLERFIETCILEGLLVKLSKDCVLAFIVNFTGYIESGSSVSVQFHILLWSCWKFVDLFLKNHVFNWWQYGIHITFNHAWNWIVKCFQCWNLVV